MEITILSAQGLKTKSSGPFSHRLRPFVTITACPRIPCNDPEKNSQVYTTRVDDHGGVNPTWGDKFHLPIDTTAFFSNRYSYICLELYTKGLIKGKVLIGGCQIPVSDLGFPLSGNSVRHLSYRTRAKDGSRLQGVVNLSVKLTGFEQVGNGSQRLLSNNVSGDHQETSQGCQTVIGIPVTMFSQLNFCQ